MYHPPPPSFHNLNLPQKQHIILNIILKSILKTFSNSTLTSVVTHKPIRSPKIAKKPLSLCLSHKTKSKLDFYENPSRLAMEGRLMMMMSARLGLERSLLIPVSNMSCLANAGSSSKGRISRYVYTTYVV